MARTSPKPDVLAAKTFPQTEGEKSPFWMPLPDETLVEYFQFKFYLDMGVARTLKAVAEAVGNNGAAVKALSKRRDWDNRVLAYEKHLAEIEFAARDQQTASNAQDWSNRRDSIREEAYQVSRLLINKAREMLSTPLEQITESEVESVDEETGRPQVVKTVIRMPAKWGFRDAANFLKTADDMARLAAEMSTSNVNVNVTERKVQLTINMVVDMASKGMSFPVIQQKLLEVGVEKADIDQAIGVVKEQQK